MSEENEFLERYKKVIDTKNRVIYELESLGFTKVLDMLPNKDETITFSKEIYNGVHIFVKNPFSFKIFRIEIKLKNSKSQINIGILFDEVNLFETINLISDNIEVFICALNTMSGKISLDFGYFPRNREYSLRDEHGQKLYLSVDGEELSLYSRFNQRYI